MDAQDARLLDREARRTRLEPMRVLAHTWLWNGNATDVTYELAPCGPSATVI